MSHLQAEVNRLLRIVRGRAAARDDDEADDRPAEYWAWADTGCPCGKPPGTCVDHPRARAAQRPPESSDWRTWLFQGGRGTGKTRAGAEWVRSLAAGGRGVRIALVAPTAADVRDVMIEGESGILACCPPDDSPAYEPSKRRLSWRNGAKAYAYSADEPERLRGPAHSAAWVDEIGSWRRPAAWSNLQFGMRLGKAPKVCVTYTPRPTALIRELIAAPTSVRTLGTTYDNRIHLAPEFIAETIARYEGTRLGLQEIHAELLEVSEGAWFTTFSTARHVTTAADYVYGVPVRLAIDCGVSRCTGAVLFQIMEVGPYRHKVNVFGSYFAEGRVSEENALAIKALADQLINPNNPAARGILDRVRLDPAATARTGIGPSALGEYQRVFGTRTLSFWPLRPVADGLDQIEILLGSDSREPDLTFHPRCVDLIGALKTYQRAFVGGEWQDYPQDPQHPAEDLVDALRGGLADGLPEGRRGPPKFLRRVHPRNLL